MRGCSILHTCRNYLYSYGKIPWLLGNMLMVGFGKLLDVTLRCPHHLNVAQWTLYIVNYIEAFKVLTDFCEIRSK